MACNDVISIEKLQRSNQDFEFSTQVLTGKVGGESGGADLDTVTHARTGQVQTTLPKSLRDVGFKPGAGDFSTGFTVLPGQYDIAWRNPVDNNWYSFIGAIPSPAGYPVAPGTNPVGSNNWKPVTDSILRSDLASSSPGKGTSLVFDSAKKSDLQSGGGSGMIGFMHQLAYAPASAGFRLANAVYITDAPFLATPNTTADQTVKIQQAIDHSMSFAKPKLLVIPHGTFTVDGNLNWPAGKTPHVMGLGESSVIQRQVGSNNYIFTFNDNFYLHDVFFAGAVNGGVSKAVKANAGNTAKFERNYFQLQDVGVELNLSFAVEFTSNVFDVCKIYGVVSTTACHNIVFRYNHFFTCGVAGGGHAISLLAATDNIVIGGNDFEYCNVNLRLTSATAVSITGNYMEYHKAACFDFVGTLYGVAINHNWIALGDTTATGSVQNLSNINGGEFIGNTVFNQTINFEPSLVGFDVGINTKTGTGTLGKTPFISPTLINSWVQQENYSVVGFRKDSKGYVHIKGSVVGGTGQSIIFTLPTEYRPTDGTKTFSCASASGPCTINVGTNGNVVALTAVSNNPGLDGIIFYVG
jgi:hypothetical protein